MYNANDVVIYENVDGLVKIQLIKPAFKMVGFQVWNVKVLEIVKKSSFGGNPKVGQREKISERWFVKKAKV